MLSGGVESAEEGAAVVNDLNQTGWLMVTGGSKQRALLITHQSGNAPFGRQLVSSRGPRDTRAPLWAIVGHLKLVEALISGGVTRNKSTAGVAMCKFMPAGLYARSVV